MSLDVMSIDTDKVLVSELAVGSDFLWFGDNHWKVIVLCCGWMARWLSLWALQPWTWKSHRNISTFVRALLGMVLFQMGRAHRHTYVVHRNLSPYCQFMIHAFLLLELTRRWLFVIPEYLKPQITFHSRHIDVLIRWASEPQAGMQLYIYAMLTYSSSLIGIGEVGIWEFFIYCTDSWLRWVRDKFHVRVGWSLIACEFFHKFAVRAEGRRIFSKGGHSSYYGVEGSLQIDPCYASQASFTYAGPSINDGRSAESDPDSTFLRTPWILVHHSATEFRRFSWTSLLSTLVPFHPLGIQRKHKFL